MHDATFKNACRVGRLMLTFTKDGKVDTEHNILVFQTEVEYEHVFHLKDLYKLMNEWLEEEGFVTDEDVQSESSLNFKEIMYWERNADPKTVEHQWWWRVCRYPEVSKPHKRSYHRLFFRINVQTLNFSKVEVMYKDQKVKLDKGDFVLRLDAWVQLDYRREWERGILRKVDRIFRKKLYHKEIEDLKGDARATAYRLQQTVKEYLELAQPHEQAKLFHTYKGYKYPG